MAIKHLLVLDHFGWYNRPLTTPQCVTTFLHPTYNNYVDLHSFSDASTLYKTLLTYVVTGQSAGH
jgi:hypothetical protein